MRAPACPVHGRLMLDLALGRLDDAPAAEAERVRLDCPTCAAWWRAELEGEPAARIDRVVGETFASFEPAARRRRAPAWLPVAAAAAVVVGAGLVLQLGDDRTAPSEPSRSAVVLETFDGDRDGNGVVDIHDLGFAAHVEGGGDTIFAGSQDDGDLDGWNSHT